MGRSLPGPHWHGQGGTDRGSTTLRAVHGQLTIQRGDTATKAVETAARCRVRATNTIIIHENLEVAVAEPGAHDRRGRVAVAGNVRKCLGDDVVRTDGTSHELAVVAIHERELAFGALVVSLDLADDHLARSLVDAVHLTAAQGASAAELSAAIGTLRDRYPGLQVQSREDILRDVRGQNQPELWANVLLLSTLSVLAYLGVLNTLVAGALDRSREFALLRVAGAHARQILWQTRFEAAMIGAMALGISAAIAGTTLGALQVSFTGTVVPQVPTGLLVALLGLPLLALVGAMEVATRAALHRSPVQTIGSDR